MAINMGSLTATTALPGAAVSAGPTIPGGAATGAPPGKTFGGLLRDLGGTPTDEQASASEDTDTTDTSVVGVVDPAAVAAAAGPTPLSWSPVAAAATHPSDETVAPETVRVRVVSSDGPIADMTIPLSELTGPALPDELPFPEPPLELTVPAPAATTPAGKPPARPISATPVPMPPATPELATQPSASTATDVAPAPVADAAAVSGDTAVATALAALADARGDGSESTQSRLSPTAPARSAAAAALAQPAPRGVAPSGVARPSAAAVAVDPAAQSPASEPSASQPTGQLASATGDLAASAVWSSAVTAADSPVPASVSPGQVTSRVPSGTSQTAMPQTAMPQPSVPQTAVPQTAVPQTPAPQTAVPQTAVPQTAVPQTAVPQTAVPQTAVPQTAVPQTAVSQTAGAQAVRGQTAAGASDAITGSEPTGAPSAWSAALGLPDAADRADVDPTLLARQVTTRSAAGASGAGQVTARTSVDDAVSPATSSRAAAGDAEPPVGVSSTAPRVAAAATTATATAGPATRSRRPAVNLDDFGLLTRGSRSLTPVATASPAATGETAVIPDQQPFAFSAVPTAVTALPSHAGGGAGAWQGVGAGAGLPVAPDPVAASLAAPSPGNGLPVASAPVAGVPSVSPAAAMAPAVTSAVAGETAAAVAVLAAPGLVSAAQTAAVPPREGPGGLLPSTVSVVPVATDSAVGPVTVAQQQDAAAGDPGAGQPGSTEAAVAGASPAALTSAAQSEFSVLLGQRATAGSRRASAPARDDQRLEPLSRETTPSPPGLSDLQGILAGAAADSRALGTEGEALPAASRVDRIAAVVGSTAVSGLDRLEMDIKWQDIGVTRVTVELVAASARVQVLCASAESAATVRALEAPLRERLQTQGLQLQDFRTGHDGSPQPDTGQTGSSDGNARREAAPTPWTPAPRQQTVATTPTSAIGLTSTAGSGRRLDILV